MRKSWYGKPQAKKNKQKPDKLWAVPVIICLCMALKPPFFAVQSFAAEIPEDAGKEQMPREVLYDSLEPLTELELTPREIAAAEAESKPQVKAYAAVGGTSEWKKYASTYYYERMKSEQKAFWNRLDAQCEEYLIGTKDVSFDGSACYLPLLTYENLTYGQARSVYLMFRYSNPQYYFLGNSLRYSEEQCIMQISVLDEFADGTKRAAATASVKAKIEEMLAEINEEDTDLMKEKMAHDLICEKVEYDKYYNTSMNNKFNQTIYSVLCTDSTVCAGYSQTMMLLMNGVGIECAMVTSQTHAWNLVCLDGNWYYTDLTWDDQEDNWIYTYFNRSRSVIRQLDTGSHTEEEFWMEYLPVLTKDAQVKRTAEPVITMQNGNIVMTSSGEDIYYTLNSGVPFRMKNAVKYTDPLPVRGEMNIVAVTFSEGCFESKRQKFYVYQAGPKKICRVTFDSCGGSATEAQNIEEGGKAVPKQPVRQGYTFEGWYTSRDYKYAYDFSAGVTSDITLYAKWKANAYRITYKANGGYIGKKSVSSQKKTVTYDRKYGKQPKAKRNSYVFLGWYTKKNGGSKIEDSRLVDVTGNKVYYAHWAKVKPKKAAISSVKSEAAGKMTVNIKSVATASGYEIRYSQKSSMASAKEVKTGSVTKTVSGLKKGRKYYVQVRMYQKESVSGKIHYGAWSGKKAVKVKKK